MIPIKTKTDECITMTPEQARELAKELNYMADETEDHKFQFQTELRIKGEELTTEPLVIIVKE